MPQDHEQVTATAVNSVDESLSENDAHSLEGEAIDKQPQKGLTAAKDPTRKGKTSAGKTVQSCKPTGRKSSSKQALPKANEAGTKTVKRTAAVDPSKLFEEMDDIKDQLKQLTGSLSSITPIITEIKAAYDNYNNQAVDRESDDGSEDAVFDPSSGDDADVLEEPPKKKAKGDSSVLAVMAKMVNKPQQDGEDLTPELSELVKQLLSKGTAKEARDEMMDKFPTLGNCNRLEVVRVNPEIFNSVRKEVKTEDVMLQKPLLKGITAVTRILDDFMKAEKGNKPAPSSAAVMKTLSDSISLLCDASHEIDLRRRALFKGDMKTEYRMLCSDQNPVEDGLLFGTELGKSVKDSSEASKVTSKVTLKQKRPHSSGHSYQGKTELRRPFPFLGRGRGAAAKQRGNYRNPPQRNQPPYQPRR